MSLRDEQLADEATTSEYWRISGKFYRYWEIPERVRNSLRNRRDEYLGDEFEKMAQRVTNIIRSRWTKKAVATRRKRKEARAEQIDKTISKVLKQSREPEFKLVGGGRNK